MRPARGHWPQRLREWQRVSGDPPLELLGLLAQLGYAKLSQTESFRLNLFQLEQCGLMTHPWHQCRVLLSFLYGREVSGNPPHGSTAAVPALLVGNSLF